MPGTNGEKVFPPLLNEAMAWGFRVILAIGISVSGWMLTRVIAVGDDIQASVHSHDIKLEVIDERAKENNAKIKGMNGEIADHEARIRELEKFERNGFDRNGGGR
jgi:hypothetical protein